MLLVSSHFPKRKASSVDYTPSTTTNWITKEEFTIYRDEDGVIGREDGPAKIQKSSAGVVTLEEWFRNGVLHREGEPARFVYDFDGNLVERSRHVNGDLEGGSDPALEQWDSEGDLENVEYWVSGRLHREDGPAVTRYKRGQIEYEGWYRDGKHHREDGPAEIKYANGMIWYERWFLNGSLHREGGPAVISYDKEGKPRPHLSRWYISGQRINENEQRQLLETAEELGVSKEELQRWLDDGWAVKAVRHWLRGGVSLEDAAQLYEDGVVTTNNSVRDYVNSLLAEEE